MFRKIKKFTKSLSESSLEYSNTNAVTQSKTTRPKTTPKPTPVKYSSDSTITDTLRNQKSLQNVTKIEPNHVVKVTKIDPNKNSNKRKTKKTKKTRRVEELKEQGLSEKSEFNKQDEKELEFTKRRSMTMVETYRAISDEDKLKITKLRSFTHDGIKHQSISDKDHKNLSKGEDKSSVFRKSISR